MQKLLIIILLNMLLFSPCTLSGFLSPQTLNVGPEIYHIKRIRHGGTHQKGFLYGATMQYEHLSEYGLYLSAQARLAYGQLTGLSGKGQRISSHQLDSDLEGCLGGSYSFHKFTLAAFGGGGYYYGMNKYEHPTPIHLKFRDTFSFLTLGSLIQWNPDEGVILTLAHKVRFMIDGCSKIMNDPHYDAHALPMNEQRHYEISLSQSFIRPLKKGFYAVSFTSFYRYRHYGERANFPFDFIDTKFIIYGINASASYLF